MAQVEDPDQIWSKRKAINALFPYAVWRERGGDHRMVDAFLGIARAPNIGILVTEPIVTALFDGASPGSSTRVVTLVSPYVRWVMPGFNKNTVTWWAAAALAVPYTEEVGPLRAPSIIIRQLSRRSRCARHSSDLYALLYAFVLSYASLFVSTFAAFLTIFVKR